MIKFAAAVSGAALLAGTIVLLPGMTPMVVAHSAPANTINSDAKSDRLDLRQMAAGCSEQAWPYYEASCLRSDGHAKPVRIVTTDRLPAHIRFATSD